MKIKKKNTTIPINGKIVDTENVEDKTSNAPSMRLVEEMMKSENFENYVTFNEKYANVQLKKIGKLININYQGESKEHSTGEILFTIPKEYRPKATITAGNFSGGLVGENVAYGSLFIRDTGVCEIATIKNGNTPQRLLFNITYILD